MSGLGKGVLGMVGISRDEVGAGTFPDTNAGLHAFHLQAYLLNPASTKTPVGESLAQMAKG